MKRQRGFINGDGWLSSFIACLITAGVIGYSIGEARPGMDSHKLFCGGEKEMILANIEKIT